MTIFNRILKFFEHSSESSQEAEVEAVDVRAALEQERESLGAAHSAFVERLVVKHRRVLGKKLRQHLRKDEYGKEIGFDEAGEEVTYFLSHVVATEPGYQALRQQLIEKNVDIALLGHNRSDYDIDALVERYGERLDENMIGLVYLWATESDKRDDAYDEQLNISAMSGTEFEAYCAERLESHGWSVHRKGGTGDQGVDLIAHKGSTSVAIQCKRHARSVGNEAVQQVAAGQRYEEADLAVVVSNGAYTESAQRLASKLGVLLIHHSDLDTLQEHDS